MIINNYFVKFWAVRLFAFVYFIILLLITIKVSIFPSDEAIWKDLNREHKQTYIYSYKYNCNINYFDLYLIKLAEPKSIKISMDKNNKCKIVEGTWKLENGAIVKDIKKLDIFNHKIVLKK